VVGVARAAMAVATERNQMDEVMYMDDERNAPFFGRPGMRPRVPPRRTVVVPPSRSPTVVYAPGSSPAAHFPAYPGNYNYTPSYPTSPVFVPPGFGQPLGAFAARFGLTMGELIDSALQILAAITGLPREPIAQGDAEIDTSNLVLYQTALAKHAKRDEQIRTIGNLLVRILK
jgi:hypothetical protein